MKSPGQLVLLHFCSTCNELVPYPSALQIAPNSPGANHPLHPKCVEADRRWIGRPHLAGEWNMEALESGDTWEWIDLKAAP